MYIKGKWHPNRGKARFKLSGMGAVCWHAKNCAARDRGYKLYGETFDDMSARILGVQTGAMNPNLFDRKTIKLGFWERPEIKTR